MITLQSDRMRVTIAEPGEPPADGCRFDHAGFITDVVLDGAVHFCANEPRNLRHPTSGGCGLCCEFNADLSGEAAVGEWYPKLGVGLLKKDGDGYVFYRRYKELIPFPTSVTATRQEARFVTSPLPALGYALETTRHIQLSGTTLLSKTSVQNLGERPVAISEYCHNFLSVDGMALSPDYHLLFPTLPCQSVGAVMDAFGQPCDYRAEEQGFTFAKHGAQGAWLHLDIGGVSGTLPFPWMLRHDGARAGVAGQAFFLPAKIDLWSADHVFCPEIFYHQMLGPGECGQWQRCWTFYADDVAEAKQHGTV